MPAVSCRGMIFLPSTPRSPMPWVNASQGLEFIHAAGAQLDGSQPFSAIHPTEFSFPECSVG